jgi:hypothetical protein
VNEVEGTRIQRLTVTFLPSADSEESVAEEAAAQGQ